jgi:hypothetical protein
VSFAKAWPPNENGAPPGTDTLSAPATGESLTSVTVMVTVAGVDVACSSEAVNVNGSGPKKFAFGV